MFLFLIGICDGALKFKFFIVRLFNLIKILIPSGKNKKTICAERKNNNTLLIIYAEKTALCLLSTTILHNILEHSELPSPFGAESLDC